MNWTNGKATFDDKPPSRVDIYDPIALKNWYKKCEQCGLIYEYLRMAVKWKRGKLHEREPFYYCPECYNEKYPT